MHNKYQIHVFTAQRQILDIVYIDLTNPYPTKSSLTTITFCFKSYLAYTGFALSYQSLPIFIRDIKTLL